MNNKGNSSSSFDWKKVVGIIAAIVVIIILILSLISCQKKKSNSDKPKERKVEEKDKKPKKKDKDDSKLEIVEEDVVIYSDFSDDTSTAKVTKTSNNTNNASKKEEKKDEDPVDETKPDIGDVTKAIVENTNTIALTFTVTDESAVEVKIGEEVLTAVEGQYKFVATANGSYTITATDENGNESTETVEVTELIDVDNIITRGDVDRGQYQRRWNQQTHQYENVWVPGTGRNDYYRSTINVDSSDVTVSHVRYAATNSDHSEEVTTSTFNPETGQYPNSVNIHGRNRDVTAVSGNSKEITSQNNRNYYYVYYEASKTTEGVGTAKVAGVETVNFTS